MSREIPLHTLKGVPDALVSVHPFTTEHRVGLSLHRFSRGPCNDVVLLVHGLTTSMDMFIMPEHENLVRYLHRRGFTDVWCLDSRMSNRFPYNLGPHGFSFDDLALFDYPAAVAKIREYIGDRRLHVISHCLGAVSFAMSLFGGAVSGIASLVVNSAALVIEVPAWSAVKLAIAPFLIEDVLGLPYVSPRWSEDTRLSRGKIVSRAVSLFHPECDVPACHMLSLMWGTGHPAVYQHDQLDEVTHRRGGDLYGSTSLCYHRHVRQIVRAGRAVKRRRGDPRYDRLPDDYLERAGDVTTPVLLVTGAENRVFGRSNVLCHRELDRVAPGRHELQVVPRYGHQDIFVGKNSAAEVFPGVLAFLESSRSAGVPRSTVKRGRESNGGVPSLRDAGA